jgi:hypothetical protein
MKRCAAAGNCLALMRIVAIRATHLVFKHRVMMRQLELCPDFEVTLETGVRRFSRIDYCAAATAGFDVLAARSVTRFASHLFGIFASSR